MKKVAILGDTLVGDDIFGIQRFAYEILSEVDNINPPYEIAVIVPKHTKIKVHFKNIKIVKYGFFKNPFLWRQICFPLYCKMNHCISVDMTLGLPWIGCDIVCLHDCTYELYDDNFRTIKDMLKRNSYLFRTKRLVQKAKKIVTVSNYSKKNLLDYYNIGEEKITVIYNSWQHFDRIDADYDILKRFFLNDKDYYFSLGSGLRHKNIPWILNAAKRNRQAFFVITGSDKFSNLYEKMNISDLSNVIYTGYLKDEEIKALMSRCVAFIFPSFCEGFGIPPLEALACGANIIVSKSTCLPEIYGEAAVYLDPYDYNIDMDDYKRYPEKRDKSKVLSKYSWKISAEKFLDVVNSIV